MDGKKIGKKLKDLRTAKGCTVTEVAKACRISPQAVTQYESGERIPRDDTKIDLANYFQTTVGCIFFAD